MNNEEELVGKTVKEVVVRKELVFTDGTVFKMPSSVQNFVEETYQTYEDTGPRSSGSREGKKAEKLSIKETRATQKRRRRRRKVKEYLDSLEGKTTQKKLAKMFGVTDTTIQHDINSLPEEYKSKLKGTAVQRSRALQEELEEYLKNLPEGKIVTPRELTQLLGYEFKHEIAVRRHLHQIKQKELRDKIYMRSRKFSQKPERKPHHPQKNNQKVLENYLKELYEASQKVTLNSLARALKMTSNEILQHREKLPAHLQDIVIKGWQNDGNNRYVPNYL